jgi:hypothetical protein
MAAAVLGSFVVTLDALIVNVVPPAMGRGFGGGMTDLQWVVDGYIVMFAVLLLARTAGSPDVQCRSTGPGRSRPSRRWAPSPVELSRPAPSGSTHRAGGVLNASRQLGGALAVAGVGALAADAADFHDGLRVSLRPAAFSSCWQPRPACCSGPPRSVDTRNSRWCPAEPARRDRTASVHALLSGDSEAGQSTAAARTET